MTHILIIKQSAFGDFIQALGAIRAIRAHHKGAKITLLTTKPFVELAQASGYVDDVRIDKRPKWYDIIGWLELRLWLNAKDFTHVYDLQNSSRTALYAQLISKPVLWCGITRKSERESKDRRALHVFDALRIQLQSAGIADVTYDDLSWVKADVPALPTPYVLVVPGCSPTRLAKRWPPENYIEVCKWLTDKGYTPILIGTKDEADVTALIKSAVPHTIDLTGQTSLFQIAVLARGAAAAIGNDTGPIQMIGPTGCKTLGLFPGFSNPARHGPLGANVHTLQGDTMASISTDRVISALTQMLNPALLD